MYLFSFVVESRGNRVIDMVKKKVFYMDIMGYNIFLISYILLKYWHYLDEIKEDTDLLESIM